MSTLQPYRVVLSRGPLDVAHYRWTISHGIPDVNGQLFWGTYDVSQAELDSLLRTDPYYRLALYHYTKVSDFERHQGRQPTLQEIPLLEATPENVAKADRFLNKLTQEIQQARESYPHQRLCVIMSEHACP